MPCATCIRPDACEAVCQTSLWIPVTQRLPDADMTVLVALDPNEPFSEPVWMGFLDGDVWRDVAGERIAVTHWREIPAAPSPPYDRTCMGSDEPPVHIDQERMNRALAGPRFRLPEGLTQEQIAAFLNAVSEAYHAGVKDGADGVPSVFDELVAFADASETKPTFADAVRIALAHKQRAHGAGGNDGR